MIKVNLLPPEYRKVEGTPVARFVALLLGVFLTASAMSVWGYVHMGLLAEVRDQRVNLEQDLVGLQALAERSQMLAREFKEYQHRRDTIEKIGESRMLWSKKLDELADIIHNKGDSKRHLAWLSSIRSSVSTGKGGGAGKLELRGLSGGEEMARCSDFHKDLTETSIFFDDFERIDPPAGRKKGFDDDRTPNFGWEFSWVLDLKTKAKDKKKKSE